MNFKKLLVVAVAGAFALPFAAQVSAAGDNLILAQSSSSGGDAGAPPSGASSTGTGPTGGVASPRSAGEPKAPMAGERPPAGASSSGATASTRGRPDFSAIDKNGDGQISRAEWDAFYRDRDRGAASGGATSSGSAVTPSGSGKTGTTAGPGEASPRTAPSSDTATSGSSSGTGKAQ
jgi:hypothetical protein